MKNIKGFTLIELMVGIVISSIMMVFGVPAYTSLIANNNAYTEKSLLFNDLQLARSQAINQGLPVTICEADTSGPGPYACNTSPFGWSQGWIISVASGAGQTVLRVQSPITSGSTLISNSGNTLAAVVYSPFGFTLIKGSISVTPNNSNSILETICISAVGKMAVVEGGDNLCP